MRSLIQKYPDAVLVGMTPLHREIEEHGERRLLDFVKVEREVAEYLQHSFGRFVCRKRDSAPGTDFERKVLSRWTAPKCCRT